MLNYVALFALAAGLSAGLTPVFCRLAPVVGAMDMPHGLGLHSKPTPRIGGIAIFVALLMSGLAALWGIIPLSSLQNTQLQGLLLGAGILAAVGLLDDLRCIAPEVKFSWEVLGALVTIAYGVEVSTFQGLWVALPLTLVYFVGGANSLNLLDGMDGLAAGVGCVSALFLGVLALLQGNVLVVVICIVAVGATLGFLPYNLHVARTFMGDSGSLHLGFLIAGAAVLLANRPLAPIWFFAPLLVMGLPLLDTVGALIRRKTGSSDMFTGDRRHLYDLLIRKGFSYWKTVVSFWLTSIAFGLTAILAVRLKGAMPILVFGVVILVAIICALYLGLFSNEEPELESSSFLGVVSLSDSADDYPPAAADRRGLSS